MNRVTGGLVMLGLVVGVGVSAALQQADAKPVGKQMEITGTVVDMACYFNKGSHGPKHVECATMCAKAGVPFAIKAPDGQIYIPAVHAESQNPKLLPFVEQEVVVTGTVYPAAGANTIEIATIAKK